MKEHLDHIHEKHEHEHDHHHDCHHDHYHEHDHHDHGPVRISHHDSSVIGSVQGTIPSADFDEAEKKLAEQMREAGKRITEAGGIIGHIKFIITGPGRCAQISVTDMEENIRHFDGNSCRTEGVAIVFAVGDETLETILTETIGSIMENA